MNIRDFLKSVKLTRHSFANQLGVRRSTVQMWLSGKTRPRPEMAAKIEKLTEGKVTFSEAMGHNQF